MKKIIFAFCSFCLLAFTVVAPWQSAVAQQPEECDTVFCGPGLEGGNEILGPELEGSGIVTGGSLIDGILFWVRILLIVAGVLAFVAFVWAGFLYITSFASEENNEKAKKILIYTGIGIIVILISYILTDFFINATV